MTYFLNKIEKGYLRNPVYHAGLVLILLCTIYMITILFININLNNTIQKDKAGIIQIIQKDSKSPYYQLHIVFKDQPKEYDIRAYLTLVLERYNLPPNKIEITKIGNLLVELRKKSKSCVAEMDILQNILTYGDAGVSLEQQAIASESVLEKSRSCSI